MMRQLILTLAGVALATSALARPMPATPTRTQTGTLTETPTVPAAPTCDAAVPNLPAERVLGQGAQDSLTLPGAISRVAVGDPAVADVTLTGPRRLLLLARKAGETSLMVWTPCASDPQRMAIKVTLPQTVSDATQSLLAAPAAQAGAATLPSQVQADIRFVELSRSRLLELGTRLQGLNSNGLVSSFSGTSASVVQRPGLLASIGFPLDGNAFNIVWGGGSSRFLSAINLLEQTGYAYTLSQPSLVAMSGQSAYFLAGGEIPIPIPQGNLGAVGIEYKEFGVRLTLTPTVVSSQQILLKVAPEVSDLDFTNAITIQGSTIPALRIRRTDTTISLADGESFIISGLVGRTTVNSARKLPFLGDLPVIGAFFRSTRFQTDDRELLMIVTPRLVRPLRADAELPALPGAALQRYDPSAGSLFWQGSQAPYRLSAPIGFSR